MNADAEVLQTEVDKILEKGTEVVNHRGLGYYSHLSLFRKQREDGGQLSIFLLSNTM